jgi:hypothetical protein
VRADHNVAVAAVVDLYRGDVVPQFRLMPCRYPNRVARRRTIVTVKEWRRLSRHSRNVAP